MPSREVVNPADTMAATEAVARRNNRAHDVGGGGGAGDESVDTLKRRAAIAEKAIARQGTVTVALQLSLYFAECLLAYYELYLVREAEADWNTIGAAFGSAASSCVYASSNRTCGDEEVCAAMALDLSPPNASSSGAGTSTGASASGPHADFLPRLLAITIADLALAVSTLLLSFVSARVCGKRATRAARYLFWFLEIASLALGLYLPIWVSTSGVQGYLGDLYDAACVDRDSDRATVNLMGLVSNILVAQYFEVSINLTTLLSEVFQEFCGGVCGDVAGAPDPRLRSK